MADVMEEVFTNASGKKSPTLPSYKGESESDAILRLEAEGWDIRNVKFWRDEDGMFHAGSKAEDKADGSVYGG
jgi:hypothetical protein